MSAPSTAPTRSPQERTDTATDRPWRVVVWNDPVTLMSYVVWVLRRVLGHSEARATRLMLTIHHQGRAVVGDGPRERAEADAIRLQAHGLIAGVEPPE